MRNAGCNILYPLTDLAVVGFAEVLPKLRQFVRVADKATEFLDSHRPEAVVLVDFPGFNWHIAKRAKRRDIPVFYYLPPQMWAWGQWRIRKMRRYVDHVLCNLPFEEEWYKRRGVTADFVGHPFFDEVHERKLDQKFLERWSAPRTFQVAVLPGSRAREVQNIWPLQLQVIRELTRRYPGTRFLVACLKDSHCLWCKRHLTPSDENLDVEFFVGKTSEIIESADCSLMKSGSASLEMMARGVPSVVVYHVGRLMYQIARRLTTIDSFSLPNLLAGHPVMEEFLAVGSIEKAVQGAVEAMDRLIGNSEERFKQRATLLSLSSQFAQSGASQRASDIILSKLGISGVPLRRSA